MRKSFAVFLFAFFVCSAGLCQQKAGMPLAVVSVSPARIEMVAPTVDYTGSVHFSELSEVAAEVEGKVKKVLFEEGEKVKKGSPLVILDSEILKKRLRIAKANLKKAKVELEKAKRDLKRIEELYKHEGASEQLYEDYLYKVKALEEEVDALEASCEELAIKLKKKTIRAPFDAVVIKKQKDVGEWLSPGDTCCVIGKISPIDVIVSTPAEYLKYLKPKEPIYLTIPAVSDKPIKASVFSIIPQADIASRTFPVKIRLSNEKGLYLDGMKAKVKIPISFAKKELVVKRDALVSFQGGTFVFTVKDKKAQIIPVKVKGYYGDLAIVESQILRPGMPVVVRGNERLRPSQPVKIK